MRLQELKTKSAVRIDEGAKNHVRFFLQSSFYELQGTWQWEMATDALFCSDVMATFPPDFTGTKAIFHPDDAATVTGQLLAGNKLSFLRFRIITTYGEIKTVTGENITVAVDEKAAEEWQRLMVQALFQEQEGKAAFSHLQLLRDISEQTGRFSLTGFWYFNTATNKAWYSDYVFRLHGLPPNSLNAHLHTFHPFIHPEDQEVVTEFLDKSYSDRTPLHLDYRIAADGQERWISYKSGWFFSERGEAIVGGLYQDITKQKGDEREIEAYKNVVQFQRQQMVYDEQQVNIGHWQVALLTRKATYTDQYYRIFGVKPQSLPSTITSFLSYIHPDDRDRVDAFYKKVIYEHDVPDIEFRIIRADGKIRYVVQKAKLLLYEEELVVSGIIQDLTIQRMLERKVASLQERLLQSAWLQQQGDEAGSLASWVMNLEEDTIDWSESFYKLLGFQKPQPQNVTEKTLFSLVHPHDVKDFRKRWEEAARQKLAATFDFRTLQRGSVHYMRAVFSHQMLNGKTYFVGTVQDHTGVQVLQQQLSQRVQLAESLTENILDRVMITDSNNTILLWNKACEEAYAIKKAEAIGQNFFDIFPHLKTEEEMQLFHRVQKGEKVVVEGTKSALGNEYYNLYLLPLYQNNEVTGVLHVINDVTKEIELRQSLHERLQLIENIVQSSPDRIIALDRHLNYLYWNKRAEEYYRLPKEEVIGKNILEVFPQMVNDPSYGEIRQALKGETVHLPVAPDRGKYFETYIIPIKNNKGEVTSLLWVTHDLTQELEWQEEQPKVQQQLQEEHRRMNEAQAIGHIGSFEWNAATDVIFWSDEMYRIHGLEPQSETITFERVLSFIPPDDEKNVAERIKWCRKEVGAIDLTHRIKRADGEVRMVRRQLQSFADDKGAITHLSGTLQDVTSQKLAEEALLESKLFIEQVMDATPDFIMVFNFATNKVEYVNHSRYKGDDERYRETLQISYEQLITRAHPGDREALRRFIENFRTAKDNDVRTVDYRVVQEAEVTWYRSRGKVFKRDERGKPTHYISVVQDITVQKKAMQELLQLKDELTQKATDKYQTLFNSIDEGFYLAEVSFDENNRPVDVFYHEENPAAVHILGVSVKGKKLSEVSHQYEPYWYEIFGNVALTVEGRRLEQYAQHNNKWFNFYVTKIGDEASRQIAIVFQDITQRKSIEEALRQSEEKYRSLFQIMDEGFCLHQIIFDEEGQAVDQRYLEVNPAFEQLTGLKNVVGKSIRELVPGIEYSWLQIHGEVVKTGLPVRYENYIGDLDKWFDVYAFRVGAPEDGKVAVLFNDTTQRKKLEQQLTSFNELLEQQVAERTQALKESTEELQKNFTILQQAEDMAQMGSWEYDLASGNFTWSEGMYKMFGLPQGSKVVPETYLSFAVEEDRSVAKRIIKNLKKGQQPFEEAMRIKRGNEQRLLKVKGSVVHDETGREQRMIGVDVDITDIKEAEKKAEESRNLLEQTALASPDAISIYDFTKKQPVYLNNCLAEWIGTTTEQLVKMGIDGRLQLVHADDRLRLLHFNEKLKAANDGQVLTLEYRIHVKDGTLLWIRNRSKPFRRDSAGNVTHILSVLQDITEEKASERVLKALNASLEKKNAELESANEEITSFAFVASHDLKEPLRKIHTFSDLLMTKEEHLSEAGRETLEKMSGSVKRLDQLINDILALTKVHVDRAKLKPVDLDALFQRLKEEMHEKLERSGAVIEAKPLPKIVGVENQLFYLFTNLVSNGLKFQAEEGQPHIVIKAEKEAQFLKISVSDNGIGIAPEYHKRIFEMFRRLHGRTEYEGTGMGLAICKKIMEKHGGKITVESEAGNGATFTCWFPSALSTL